MTNTAIFGGLWGDEGKGKLTDIYAPNSDLVVRFGGGANAGHSVHDEDLDLALHLIPCGIRHEGVLNIIANGTVAAPSALIEQIQSLRERGLLRGELMISQHAHVTLPSYIIQEQQKEGRQKIGTTGKAIGPTYEHKVSREAVRMIDLLSDAKTLREKVLRANQAAHVEEDNIDATVEQLLREGEFLAPFIGNTTLAIHLAQRGEKDITLEGAQGALLDIDHGTFPFVTSSNPTKGGIYTGTGFGGNLDFSYGVFKLISTRVGDGPFPTEIHDEELASEYRNRGGEFGVTTGRPRRMGWFDCQAARYSAMINGYTHLMISKVDIADGMPSIKIATGYKLDGKELNPWEFPTTEQLARVEPIYEEMPGWNTTAGLRAGEQLPDELMAVIERIENETMVPVKYVGTGKKASDYVHLA